MPVINPLGKTVSSGSRESPATLTTTSPSAGLPASVEHAMRKRVVRVMFAVVTEPVLSPRPISVEPGPTIAHAFTSVAAQRILTVPPVSTISGVVVIEIDGCSTRTAQERTALPPHETPKVTELDAVAIACCTEPDETPRVSNPVPSLFAPFAHVQLIFVVPLLSTVEGSHEKRKTAGGAMGAGGVIGAGGIVGGVGGGHGSVGL